jgi:capsule polysaccharide export protein KpsE/RkpR
VSLQEHNIVCEQLEQSRELVGELDAKCAVQELELLSAVQHAARVEARLTKMDMDLEKYKTQAQVQHPTEWRCCGPSQPSFLLKKSSGKSDG